MTQAPHDPPTSGPRTGAEDAGPRRSRWTWSLFTLSSVAGLVLGAGVIAAGGRAGPDALDGSTTTSGPTPGA